MNLEQLKSKCRWKPNRTGHISWFVAALIFYLQTKPIPIMFFEIFDYYDYNLVMINVGWFIFVYVGMYFFIQYILTKNI